MVEIRVLVAFHKPYGVLSQFTPDGSLNRTLAEFNLPRTVYPIGRLDADSEGLLLLSDEPELNEELLHPRNAHWRTYWVQVERVPTEEALRKLGKGVLVQGYRTRPCHVKILEPQPTITQRDPPIRMRKNVPDIWLEMQLTEGKNRQVRRMTAAIGHPTLRLIRVGIGKFGLNDLRVANRKELTAGERTAVLSEP